MTRPTVLLCLALSLLATFGSTALARKPTAKELAAAKASFKQGRAYYEAGAYSDAAKEYERAYSIAPLPDLLFNIAQAYRMQGDKPKAIAAYERYLAVVTEGAIAEEARTHIAALKLKIQMEESEVARRKALEEAAAARRRAEEMEAAHKRAEIEAAARLKAQQEDTERLRRLATEEAQRQRRLREAAQRDYERKQKEAQHRGQALRRVGRAAMVIGSIFVAGSFGALAMAIRQNEKVNQFEDSEQRWSEDLDSWLKERKLFQTMFIAQSISGGSLLVLGIVLYRVGVYQRQRATEAVTPPVTLLPLLGPGSVGLSLGGRF